MDIIFFKLIFCDQDNVILNFYLFFGTSLIDLVVWLDDLELSENSI